MSQIENDINKLIKIYNTFQLCEFIVKTELIEKLPKNLLTYAKLKYLDKLGNNITEGEFVELLMMQTDGKDWINFIYLIKYYKLELDQNGFIMFTNEFLYTSIKKEPLYIWWLYNILNTHPMFKQYLSKQLLFSLQKKLEIDVLPINTNFKYDICFDNTEIAVEINEEHHEQKKQQINDSTKISLTKLHGIALLSLITDNVVNVKKIKSIVYKNLIDNKDNCLNNLLDAVTHLFNNSNIIIVKNKLLSIIRYRFKKKLTIILRKNIPIFNSLDNAIAIEEILQNNLEKYCLNIIYDNINSAITNSEYLKIFKSNFLDFILSSLLNDFDFRQDYITTIVGENLFDLLSENLDYIKYIIENKDDFADNNLDDQIQSFNDLKIILTQFTNKSEDFIMLLDLKKRSLRNPNDISVITFDDILKLLRVGINDLYEFRLFLNHVCKIKKIVSNKNVTISWKQLSKVLLAYKKKLTLKFTLMIYYTELDTIYETLINRIQDHNIRINSNSDDYYRYMKCISGKYIYDIIMENNDLKRVINQLTNTSLHKVKEITQVKSTYIESVIELKYICMPDLNQITRINLKQRLENIINEFIIITSGSDDNFTGSEIDPDEINC